MPKLTLSSITEEILAMEFGENARWTGANIGGHSVNGINDMSRGMLPEPYWTAAEDAVYAVYHYETPIAWKVADGTWVMPEHFYSHTTARFQAKIRRGIDLTGAALIMI